MPSELKIRVNEQVRTVTAAPDTPLLYVLSNELNLQGPRFGCGLGQCGSCSVLVNGVEARSCQTKVSAVEGKSVTTLEGLPALYAAQKKLAQVPALHPVQQAMIEEQAVQCGYCFNGMIVKAESGFDVRRCQPEAGQSPRTGAWIPEGWLAPFAAGSLVFVRFGAGHRRARVSCGNGFVRVLAALKKNAG
jgi:aerobic-type carbon monoxide dehydrogenase small subunit (CoxS/CutS family)